RTPRRPTMLRFSSPVTLRLERGRLLAWSRQSGVRLRVLAGSAWVTQANDMEDHFLRPGQALRLRIGAHALIGAEQDVSLRFEAERGLGLASWWRQWRAAVRERAERREAQATGCGVLSAT
ncbi:MAG: DUF2917 domain-containing protein, partial [Burkholderiales bacterium]